MLKEITIVKDSGEEEIVLINPSQVVMVISTDVPTNIVGAGGRNETSVGSALSLSNGMAVSSPATKDVMKEILNG